MLEHRPVSNPRLHFWVFFNPKHQVKYPHHFVCSYCAGCGICVCSSWDFAAPFPLSINSSSVSDATSTPPSSASDHSRHATQTIFLQSLNSPTGSVQSPFCALRNLMSALRHPASSMTAGSWLRLI